MRARNPYLDPPGTNTIGEDLTVRQSTRPRAAVSCPPLKNGVQSTDFSRAVVGRGKTQLKLYSKRLEIRTTRYEQEAVQFRSLAFFLSLTSRLWPGDWWVRSEWKPF